MQSRRPQPPLVGVRGAVGRESQRELAQLGGGVPRTAPDGQRRRLVERRGDRRVGTVDREREMARALLRIGHDRGQPAVQRAQLAGQQEAERGRAQQRVRETQPLAREGDEPGIDGGAQLQRAPAGRRLEQRRRRRGERGRDRKQVARRGRQRREPVAQQLVQLVRDVQRIGEPGQAAATLQRPRDLEREERVAARALGDPSQQRARERQAQPAAR